MLRRGLIWAIVLLPAMIAGGLLLLIASAVLVIHITGDAEAFSRTAVSVQTLARDVYERQRAIWQAQIGCIEFDEVLFYKPRPGKCVFDNIEYSTVLTFDTHGFRQTSFPEWRGDDSPTRGRIVVLGDSQAMGWGVQDEETFGSILAKEYGFEVFNLAVASYGTARELLRLRKEFDLRKGDVVVIQYHPNDLRENLAFLKSGKLPARAPSDLARLAHTPQSYGVLQVSASIAFILKGKLMNTLFGDTGGEVASGKNQAEIFLDVIDHFPELAQARLVVCEVASFGEATAFAKDLKRLTEGRMSVLNPAWESSDFYRLDDHLNAKGHRRLANVIAATILSD
ncbi:SGNH/GDSL hydrolase family protein [Nitrospira sp. NS4]|uniref:SGNH/GDSL hydrolase family protein n=1 Tax=Nitrospira sp. NS4 TaxID=3414498 RepID=UPI003C2F7FD8